MIRKVFGGLLLAVAALSLIGSVTNGSFMSDQGSVAATYGLFIGTMLPIILNVFAGVFLIRFDSVYKLTYIEGFKARKKQGTKIILFIGAYFVLVLFTGMGVGLSGTDNLILSFILSALPHFIPVMIFAWMLSMYVIPYRACGKNFNIDDSMLNQYFSSNEAFRACSEDNSVIASNKVLFFPKTYCVIPFECIASTEFKNIGVEQDVVFKLTNGKKIEMVTNKERYDRIASAIALHKQSGNL